MATKRRGSAYGPEESESEAPGTPTQTEFAPPIYPYRVYHITSRPGALVSTVVESLEQFTALGAGWGSAEELPFDTAPDGPPPPVVVTLVPSSAPLGAPSFAVHVIGGGFAPGAVIVFNGFDEPTTVASSNELTTGINMDVWLAPAVVPVGVRNPDGQTSQELSFTFLDPAAPLRR